MTEHLDGDGYDRPCRHTLIYYKAADEEHHLAFAQAKCLRLSSSTIRTIPAPIDTKTQALEPESNVMFEGRSKSDNLCISSNC